MKIVCEDKGRNRTQSTNEDNGKENGGTTQTNKQKAEYG